MLSHATREQSRITRTLPARKTAPCNFLPAMKLPLTAVLMTALRSIQAAEPEPADFISQLAVTEKMLTERPFCQHFKKLAELSPERATFLAKFWRHRAVMSRSGDLKRIEESFDKPQQPIHREMMSDRDGKIANRELREWADLVFISYYYDHLETIYSLILLNLKKATERKP